MHIKSDHERSIKKLKAQVRSEYEVEIPEEESRVGDSLSNCRIENVIQQVQGQSRTLKAQLEARLGRAIEDDHAILPRLISHSGATINRYSMQWEVTGPQHLND